MKRCPQCKRLETDEGLKFCRVDGATLVSDSSALASETGTARLDSGSVATEIETSILPHAPSHATDVNINRATVAAETANTYAVAPEFDDLRDEPRFKAMLKRMNLPE